MDDRKVTVPLMVKLEDESIQYVEEDNDTVSENEPSTGIKTNSGNTSQPTENVYNEIPPKYLPVSFLGVPKLSVSRSTSTESSDGAMPILLRNASGNKKHHDYEKLSVASGTSKKSTVEISSFFRRRHDARSDKSDDEEPILESLRHVVRKCTSNDPSKRPSSSDVLDLFSTFSEKS